MHKAYCIVTGLLQAAALTGALIMYKITSDTRDAAVLNVHCTTSGTNPFVTLLRTSRRADIVFHRDLSC